MGRTNVYVMSGCQFETGIFSFAPLFMYAGNGGGGVECVCARITIWEEEGRLTVLSCVWVLGTGGCRL